MTFSANPFSASAFSDSGVVNIEFSIVGISATGSVNGNLDVRSIVTVLQPSQVVTTSVGNVTVSGIGNTGTTGVETTTTLNTVGTTAEAVVVPTGVAATGNVNSVSTSTGSGSVVELTGVEATCITDDPLVSGDEIVVDAEAVVVPNSNDGVTSLGVINLTAEASALVDTVSAEGTTGVVILVGDANFSINGVAGTAGTNTVEINIQAVAAVIGVEAIFSVGAETVTTVQFDYEAVKENYSRDRTEYIKETANTTRTDFVKSSGNRVVYVEPQATTRKESVQSGSNRVVYVEPQANTRRAYARAA